LVIFFMSFGKVNLSHVWAYLDDFGYLHEVLWLTSLPWTFNPIINIKILTNSNQQTQSYKFTSHIAAFLSMVLITEMLYHNSVNLIQPDKQVATVSIFKFQDVNFSGLMKTCTIIETFKIHGSTPIVSTLHGDKYSLNS
jgi:uncharacterized membrane protein